VAGACEFACEVLSDSEVVRVKEQVIAALADLLSSEEAG
jgi:hypothetical protein